MTKPKVMKRHALFMRHELSLEGWTMHYAGELGGEARLYFTPYKINNILVKILFTILFGFSMISYTAFSAARPDTDEINVITWVYLEGAAIDAQGIQTCTLPMRTALNNLHLLPGQTYQQFFQGIVYSTPGQPYSSAPWQYNGTEGDAYDSNGDAGAGDAGYPATVVDWVLVSLRYAPDGSPLCRKAALLHSDGHVEFVNGGFACIDLDFNIAYYLVIEHRNHLLVMSDTAISVVNGTITYDFRHTQSYIYDLFGFGGSGQKELLPGVFAMYAGNGDQVLTPCSVIDINFDDRALREGQNGNAGRYNCGDYNLNGDCNYNDRTNWECNNGKFSTVPGD